MPVPPKSPDRRQRRNLKGDRQLSIVREFIEPPPPPAGLLKATRDEWIRLFQSSDSALIKHSDLPELSRLFWLRDEELRLRRVVRKARVVQGSMGQPVMNGAYQTISRLQAEARQLEDRFMGNVRARLAAGAQFATTHRSLDELNREAEADGDESDDRGAEDDPYAALQLADRDKGRP